MLPVLAVMIAAVHDNVVSMALPAVVRKQPELRLRTSERWFLWDM